MTLDRNRRNTAVKGHFFFYINLFFLTEAPQNVRLTSFANSHIQFFFASILGSLPVWSGILFFSLTAFC